MGFTTVRIPNGETDSDAFSIESYKVFALEMPAAFTGTAMTFKGAHSKDGTYVAVYDEAGAQVSITVGTSRIIGLDAAALEIAAIEWLKLVSGSSEGSARDIVVHRKG